MALIAPIDHTSGALTIKTYPELQEQEKEVVIALNRGDGQKHSVNMEGLVAEAMLRAAEECGTIGKVNSNLSERVTNFLISVRFR